MLNHIKEIRIARGWTQERLASEATKIAEGVTISAKLVSAYERGTRTPTFKALAPIAHALGVPVANLLEREAMPLNSHDLIEILHEKVIEECQDPEARERLRHLAELFKADIDRSIPRPKD